MATAIERKGWSVEDSGRPALNRVIRLRGRHGQVRATLEDDFHHFRVILEHDGARVRRVEADSPRFPYSLCPAAGAQLGELVGMALSDDMAAVFRDVDARSHCTHQLDLAALALTAAARGVEERRYDIVVDDGRPGEDRHARLERDGAPVYDWTLDGYAVADPEPFAGRGLGAGFTAWVAGALAPEAAEAALVLRRGVFISGGRGMADRLDTMVSAPVTGGCWVQQDGRAAEALRQRGSTLDFTCRHDRLTQDDDDWLSADLDSTARSPSSKTPPYSDTETNSGGTP